MLFGNYSLIVLSKPVLQCIIFAMKRLYASVFIFAIVMVSGCGGEVVRELTISSEPSGALVEVSGKEVGRTPVTIEFTYYGNYEVILRKEGYKTLITGVKLNPPWYQYPVIDFFTEISMCSFRDERYSHHVLEKAKTPDAADLVDRANKMRDRTIGGQ